jgi:hypothetical protein
MRQIRLLQREETTGMWKRLRLIGAATIVLVSSPSHAGLFGTALSDADAKQVKRLAVVSALADTVHGRMVGLTVFSNKGFDAPVPDWGLDKAVARQMQSRIIESGRISGNVVAIDGPFSDMKQVFALASEQGFDTVLAVLAVNNSNDRLLAPGMSVARRKLAGLDHINLCGSMILRMYRVADRKQIAVAMPDPCSYSKTNAVWHDNWADYTDAEKQETLSALGDRARTLVGEGLIELNFRVP